MKTAIGGAAALALGLLSAQPTQAQSIEISKERSTGPGLPLASPAKTAAPVSLPLAPAPAPAAAATAPAKPAPAAKPVYLLATDQPIHEALQAWARGQDWEVRWYPAVSWRTLREADFSAAPDLVAAVSEVVDILRDEGKPLRLRVSEGNRVMEVLSTEVSQ